MVYTWSDKEVGFIVSIEQKQVHVNITKKTKYDCLKLHPTYSRCLELSPLEILQILYFFW